MLQILKIKLFKLKFSSKIIENTINWTKIDVIY